MIYIMEQDIVRTKLVCYNSSYIPYSSYINKNILLYGRKNSGKRQVVYNILDNIRKNNFYEDIILIFENTNIHEELKEKYSDLPFKYYKNIESYENNGVNITKYNYLMIMIVSNNKNQDINTFMKNISKLNSYKFIISQELPIITPDLEFVDYFIIFKEDYFKKFWYFNKKLYYLVKNFYDFDTEGNFINKCNDLLVKISNSEYILFDIKSLLLYIQLIDQIDEHYIIYI